MSEDVRWDGGIVGGPLYLVYAMRIGAHEENLHKLGLLVHLQRPSWNHTCQGA